jgi:hypothetical protein
MERSISTANVGSKYDGLPQLLKARNLFDEAKRVRHGDPNSAFAADKSFNEGLKTLVQYAATGGAKEKYNTFRMLLRLARSEFRTGVSYRALAFIDAAQMVDEMRGRSSAEIVRSMRASLEGELNLRLQRALR